MTRIEIWEAVPEGVRIDPAIRRLPRGDLVALYEQLLNTRGRTDAQQRQLSHCLIEIFARQEGKHREPAPRGGRIYVFRVGTRYKLGRSKDPQRRLQELRTALPDPIELVAAFPASDAPAAERALHTRFAHRRIAGEWYALTPDDLHWIAEHQPG